VASLFVITAVGILLDNLPSADVAKFLQEVAAGVVAERQAKAPKPS
jgi:hypothetical protein